MSKKTSKVEDKETQAELPFGYLSSAIFLIFIVFIIYISISG